MTKPETRAYPRKVMRCPAYLTVPGTATMRARTIDISLGGLCLMVSEQLPVGLNCNVGFEAPLSGRMVRVTALAKVAYSILSGTDGFRTGLQFVQMDEASIKALTELTT